jgi:hypothetical protein
MKPIIVILGTILVIFLLALGYASKK